MAAPLTTSSSLCRSDGSFELFLHTCFYVQLEPPTYHIYIALTRRDLLAGKHTISSPWLVLQNNDAYFINYLVTHFYHLFQPSYFRTTSSSSSTFISVSLERQPGDIPCHLIVGLASCLQTCEQNFCLESFCSNVFDRCTGSLTHPHRLLQPLYLFGTPTRRHSLPSDSRSCIMSSNMRTKIFSGVFLFSRFWPLYGLPNTSDYCF